MSILKIRGTNPLTVVDGGRDLKRKAEDLDGLIGKQVHAVQELEQDWKGKAANAARGQAYRNIEHQHRFHEITDAMATAMIAGGQTLATLRDALLNWVSTVSQMFNVADDGVVTTRPPRTGAALRVATVLLVLPLPLTACSQLKDSPRVPAVPHDVDFPDFSTFTAADSSRYSKRIDNNSVFAFLTPLGLRCSFAAGRESRPDGISCVGPIPGREHQWSLRVERGSGARIYIELNKSGPGIFTPPEPPSPTLARHEALQINQGDMACGILDAGTPACHVGDHGFVVNPDNVVLF